MKHSGRLGVQFPMMSLEFFIDIILSVHPLKKMSTRNIFWGGGKCGRCEGLTILPPPCADFLEIWEPQTPGNLRIIPGPYAECFTSYYCASVETNFRPGRRHYRQFSFPLALKFSFIGEITSAILRRQHWYKFRWPSFVSERPQETDPPLALKKFLPLM